MPVTAAAAVALAAGLDALVGEPPTRIHPVALLGRAVARIDRTSDGQSRPRLRGCLVALALPLGFAAVAVVAVGAGARVDPWLGSVIAAGVLFSTTSLRLLLEEARNVIRASEADLDAARTCLRSLAGRDPTSLDAVHVRSAAVESLAENLADGLVAPLFAFALVAWAVDQSLALPLAAGAAAWMKAVNTLDSMLGYRSKPIGWAPARLDDAAMWLPARLAALLLAVAAGSPALPLRHRVRTLARRPSSPNSGWPMATAAALLPARLHKPGAYDLDPSGPAQRRGGQSAPLPDAATAVDAVRVTRRAGALAFVLAGVIAWL